MNLKDFLKKHQLIRQLLYMLIVSVAVIFIAFFFVKIYSRHGKEYDVPSLVGMTTEEILELPNAGYFDYVLIDSIFLPSKRQGEILTQDPPANAKAKKGRKIYLTIAAYTPEKVDVPNLIDLTVRQAISQLEAVGLQGGKLTFVEDISRNAILKQTYKGKVLPKDEKVVKGEKIDLVVGKGIDGESPSTIVPNAIGKTPEQVRKNVLSASLNVGNEYFPKGAKDARNVIFKVSRQSPSAKSSLGFGGKVDLWYSAEGSINFDRLAKEANQRDPNATGDTEEEFEQQETDW